MALSADTLVVDTVCLSRWRADAQTDYSRELVQRDTNLLDWLGDQIDRFLRLFFDNSFYADHAGTIWVVLGVAAALAVGMLIWRKRGAFFQRQESGRAPRWAAADTIYGVDFPAGIARARAAGDHREAVRLIYLQTLRRLSDTGQIVWKLYKTPTEYTREVTTTEFGRLTCNFLRVRYGNFTAAAATTDEMLRLQQAVYQWIDSRTEAGGA